MSRLRRAALGPLEWADRGGSRPTFGGIGKRVFTEGNEGNEGVCALFMGLGAHGALQGREFRYRIFRD